MSSTPLPYAIGRIAADEGLAYVCQGATGLMIFDVSTPEAPLLLTTYNTPGTCVDVAASGEVVFIADGASGLLVLDVSSPSSPQVITTFAPGSTSVLGLEGTRLGVLGGGQFRLIDVSDPAMPVQLGTVGSSAAFDVKVRGNRAYLGGIGAMTIMDLSNPALPIRIGTIESGGYGLSTHLDGNHAYVATGNDVGVFDITDPTDPRVIGAQATIGRYNDLAIVGDYIFTCGYDGSIHVLPLQCTVSAVPDPVADTPVGARLQLAPPLPNPSAGSVSFTARVPEAGRYAVTVHDVAGRRIASLPPIEADATGDIRMTWDGRADPGYAVASGYYYLILRGSGETAVRKVTIQR